MNKFKIGDRVKVLAASNNIPNYSDHVGREYYVIDVSHYGDVKLSHSIFYHDPSWLEIVPDKLPDTPDTGDMFISDWKAQSLHLATTTNMKWRVIARKLGVAETTNRNWLTSQIGSKKEWDKRDGALDHYGRSLANQKTQIKDLEKLLPKPSPERLKKLQGYKDLADAGYARGKEEVVKPPRILIWDIESAPTLAYCWGRFKQFISQDQVVSEGYLLSVAWKWLGEDETHCVMNSLSAISQEDDREVVETIHRLLEEADVIVAHNLPFDEKLSKARMVFWGMKPPASYRRIDTLAIAKKQFRFPSNKLDSLGEYLKLGRKTGHSGFSLWTGVMRGDEVSRQTMVEYNIQDVNLLEDVYLRLRHWDNTLPNLAQYYDDSNVRCPACGSKDVVSTDKYTYTALAKFTEVVCTECGHRSRKRANLFDKEKRQSIGANIL